LRIQVMSKMTNHFALACHGRRCQSDFRQCMYARTFMYVPVHHTQNRIIPSLTYVCT
jgi:hypothetical protein